MTRVVQNSRVWHSAKLAAGWCRRPSALTLLVAALVGCSKPPAPVPPPPAPTATLDQSFRTEVPKAMPVSATQRAVPTSAQLGNGFTLWFLPSEAGTLSLRLTCRIGSRDNPAQKSGLAALTTRLLTEGTQKRTALELAIAAESLGTHLEQDSNRDASSLELEVLPENEEQGIALLAEVARQPAFREKDFERVQKEWLDDLSSQRDDPNQLAWLMGYRALLGPQWGTSPRGAPQDVRRLTANDLAKFHEQHWTAERCALLAAGPSSLSAIEGAAAPLFGAWRPSKTTQRERKVTLAAPARNTVYVLDRPNAVQTALFVAGAAPRKYEPGHEARQVLNNLFGGLFTSRLNQNLREKNAYTYGAFSTFMGTRDFGFWAASTSVRTDSSEQALTEIFAEWQRLATPEGIEQAEIARAQTDLVFKVAADLEHTSALLDELEEIFVYELAADHYSNVTSALKAVTAAELALQLPHIPGGSGSVVAVVGAQSKLGDLSKFGLVRPVGLQWLDGGE